jgi:hypothetical protein
VEKKIEKELKWVIKVDPKRADKDARKEGFDVEEPQAAVAAAAAAVKKEEKEGKGGAAS